MIHPQFLKHLTPLTLKKICQELDINLPYPFSEEKLFCGISPLSKASHNDLSCYHNTKYLETLKKTQAGACLITKQFAQYVPSSVIPLIVSHPYRAFGKIATLFYPKTLSREEGLDFVSIHPSARIGKNCVLKEFCVIGEDVIIKDNCYIGPHCVIRNGTTIGKNCLLESHITLDYAMLGDEVYIKSGARIGQSGFGFHMDEKGHFDIPQLGGVVIGNNVHIGANTTIDRGSFSHTIIGQGVRIDNLVQIAHNVEIGDNSVLVAQVGIAGSTKLGKFVVAAGQAGIAGHLTIGNGAKIAAQSGLMRNVLDKETVAGSPAIPVRSWHKQTVALQKLIKDKS